MLLQEIEYHMELIARAISKVIGVGRNLRWDVAIVDLGFRALRDPETDEPTIRDIQIIADSIARGGGEVYIVQSVGR